MKISSQKREGNTIVLEIEVDNSRFQKTYEATLAEAVKEIKVSGFRAGKAPRDVAEKTLNLEVVEHRAAQNVIAEIYPEIIKAGNFEPVDYPDVEITQLEKGKPFLFKLKVEVYPEIKIGKYKGIKLEKKPVELKEEEILAVLGRLQDRFAVKDAAGKRELLPLDDEFAKKISRYGTLAELKEELRRSLLEEKTFEADTELKNRAIAAVATEAKVDIPLAMIDREINIMLDELRSSLAQSGLTLEQYLQGAKKEEKNLREEMSKSAEIRVKGKLVLRAVAEVEKLKITPEEVAAEIKVMAESLGQKEEAFKQNLTADAEKSVEDYLLRKKALDVVIGRASIKEGRS